MHSKVWTISQLSLLHGIVN